MRLDANKLSSAVRLALSFGVAATATTLGVQAQTANNNTDQKSQSLETIVVTGSNIRRVRHRNGQPGRHDRQGRNPGLRQGQPGRPRSGSALDRRQRNESAGQQRRHRHSWRIAARPGLEPHVAADQRPSYSVPVAGPEPASHRSRRAHRSADRRRLGRIRFRRDRRCRQYHHAHQLPGCRIRRRLRHQPTGTMASARNTMPFSVSRPTRAAS
mgnify:CR=1 FL=1